MLSRTAARLAASSVDNPLSTSPSEITARTKSSDCITSAAPLRASDDISRPVIGAASSLLALPLPATRAPDFSADFFARLASSLKTGLPLPRFFSASKPPTATGGSGVSPSGGAPVGSGCWPMVMLDRSSGLVVESLDTLAGAGVPLPPSLDCSIVDLGDSAGAESLTLGAFDMVKKSLKNDKQLIKDARQFFDFSELFPASKIDARRELTKYQRGKIKSSMNNLITLAGGLNHLKRDFIKMPSSESRKRFAAETGLPKGARGVMIPGGGKINKRVSFKRGHLVFKRGTAEGLYKFVPLDASTERAFESSMRKRIKQNLPMHEFISLGTYGGEIRYTARKTDEHKMPDLFIEKAMGIYNMYAALSAAGIKRDNGRIAAHPSSWGLGLLVN